MFNLFPLKTVVNHRYNLRFYNVGMYVCRSERKFDFSGVSSSDKPIRYVQWTCDEDCLSTPGYDSEQCLS